MLVGSPKIFLNFVCKITGHSGREVAAFCSASSGCFLLYIVSACFGVVQIVFWLLWTVLGCLGCLRLFRLFLAASGCVSCFGLFGVAFGCSLIVHVVSSCFELFRLLGCFRSCLVVSSWLP